VRRFIGLVTAIALMMLTNAAQAATPEVVMDEQGVNERVPSVSDGYLVWNANSVAKPRREHSYVMADGGGPVRISPPGTTSHGAAIDGTTIVYEEATAEDSDLWFYDAQTQVRSATPDGVNTPQIEHRPSLSGNWVLFTRENWNRVPFRRSRTKVVLFNLMDSTTIVLERLRTKSSYLISDQVKGDWATYESCEFRRGRFFDCQVWRYQISTDELVQMPNPGVQQYAGALSDDGTVYLVRTRNRNQWRCGSHSKLVRMPVGGGQTVIATLPDGLDALATFGFDEMDGSTTVYFDRLTCKNGRSGIYRIVDADSAGP